MGSMALIRIGPIQNTKKTGLEDKPIISLGMIPTEAGLFSEHATA